MKIGVEKLNYFLALFCSMFNFLSIITLLINSCFYITALFKQIFVMLVRCYKYANNVHMLLRCIYDVHKYAFVNLIKLLKILI